MIAVAAALWLTAAAPALAREAAPKAQRWIGDVDAIADADAGDGRRSAIERRLDAIGLHWNAQTFEAGKHGRGTNLVADVSGPADAPLLLFGAHFDRVGEGRGATDNASGSATVLALAERFKQRPLSRHRVAVAFWDLEEAGLLGSAAYIAQNRAKPALYVNFDVFGWGKTLWMMTPEADSALVAASRSAAQAAGLSLAPGEQYPPSDHRSFLKAGWPAVSYSLIGAEEVPLILAAYRREKTAETAKVMRVIHSAHDTLDEIDPAAAALGVDAVEDAIRRWDADTRLAPTSMSENGK
ncbi:M28 family metallopeptidase [Lysobacter firmicutimachus]|uniref:M28 family metallopeptidase n=1 Tax=Lysobacter firmicutimachus TaxID=1792846 RepID=A0AAU8MLI0_9GAMM